MTQPGRSHLRGLRWRDLASVPADLGRFVLWCLVAGLIGCGSGWCGAHVSSTEWMRANPPPPFRLVAELRVRRQVARGLGQLAAYLEEEEIRVVGWSALARRWPGHRRGHRIRDRGESAGTT